MKEDEPLVLEGFPWYFDKSSLSLQTGESIYDVCRERVHELVYRLEVWLVKWLHRACTWHRRRRHKYMLVLRKLLPIEQFIRIQRFPSCTTLAFIEYGVRHLVRCVPLRDEFTGKASSPTKRVPHVILLVACDKHELLWANAPGTRCVAQRRPQA